ncbi:glycosyltransferase, partial [Bacillus thuringiensis]|uniref:glycosyltransferase n=1 Tax=Bacillus thuringiensis TaxID=1428 RepID=UPI001E28FADA
RIYSDLKYIKKNKCIISHFGSFYGSRNPIEFIKAVDKLINKVGNNIHVNLVGKFQERSTENEVNELIKNLNLVDNFTIIRSLEHQKVIEMEQTSDLNLIITHTNGESNYALPGKVFEYIGAKRPIFCISGDPLLSDLMKKYQLGYLVKNNEMTCIEKGLEAAYKIWSDNKLDISLNNESFEQFNRRELTKKLNDFLLL